MFNKNKKPLYEFDKTFNARYFFLNISLSTQTHLNILIDKNFHFNHLSLLAEMPIQESQMCNKLHLVWLVPSVLQEKPTRKMGNNFI